jgi:NarL family two-component system response regulator YdfI
MSRKETGVLVVIAHRAMRDTVCSRIDGSSGLRVLAATSSKADVPRLVERVKPVVVLVEHPLGGEPMLEAVAAIHGRSRTPSVLMCLLASDDLDAAFETRGVADVVLSDRSIAHLIAVLQRDLHELDDSVDGRPRDATGGSPLHVARRDSAATTPMPPAVTPDGDVPLAMLTSQERQVLQLVASGFRTKEIAERLGVSVRTVETHRSRLHRKLGIDSIAALTLYAVRQGSVSPHTSRRRTGHSGERANNEDYHDDADA